MGEQRYLDQVLLDGAMHRHLGVVDEIDVGCERDRAKVRLRLPTQPAQTLLFLLQTGWPWLTGGCAPFSHHSWPR